MLGRCLNCMSAAVIDSSSGHCPFSDAVWLTDDSELQAADDPVLVLAQPVAELRCVDQATVRRDGCQRSAKGEQLLAFLSVGIEARESACDLAYYPPVVTEAPAPGVDHLAQRVDNWVTAPCFLDRLRRIGTSEPH